MNVTGIPVDVVDYQSASNQIARWTCTLGSYYVCIANVHILMEAHDSAKFADVVSSADMVTPDGMPLVWIMRAKGQRADGSACMVQP